MKVNYEELANMLLDDFCDILGPRETIVLLLQSGYDQAALLELKFSLDDIREVEREMNK